MRKTVSILKIFLFFFPLIINAQTYEEEIRLWQSERISNLKKENGWLNLAGLFWLNDGNNRIGADTQNEHVFPSDRADGFVGNLILNNDSINFYCHPGSKVLQNGILVKEAKLYPYDIPVILEHGSLRWFVIKRGPKYAIRLRDLDSPFLKEFHGIVNYPINKNWKVKAKFVPLQNHKIEILDITGQLSKQECPGRLQFKIGKKKLSIDALKDGDQLFLIFSDKTNKITTYGGGRYIYTDLPDKDGNVWLDFNKAYNPPCAFTPYATCPLPPAQNILKIKIEAGEKAYEMH